MGRFGLVWEGIGIKVGAVLMMRWDSLHHRGSPPALIGLFWAVFVIGWGIDESCWMGFYL